jgi:hypothetical protein
MMVIEHTAERITAVAQQMSGKEIALLRPPPLRTVRASCPAHGSSLCGGEEIPCRTEHPILVSPDGRLATPVLRSVQLALSNVSVG